MRCVARQWVLFKTALMFFTRIPLPLPQFQERDLNGCVQYFPLVGALVGAVAALVFWLAAQGLPITLAVLLSMGATIYLTGAFHEDGLADSADGLGGGWEREQVLTIMQDSRIGSYGVISLCMVLLGKWQLLSATPAVLLPAVMVCGHALSRFAAVLVIFRQTYVRATGKSKPLATRLARGQLLQAALFGVSPLVLLAACVPAWLVLLGLVPVVIVWFWFSRLLSRRLGGYTGDCLGAMQQVAELAFYLGILLALGIGRQ